MKYDLAGALAAGVSKRDIADYLAGNAYYDLDGARAAGVSDDDIIAFLMKPEEPSLMDRAKQGVADTVTAGKITLTQDPAEVARLVAEAERNRLPLTDAQKQMAADIAPYQQRYQETKSKLPQDNVPGSWSPVSSQEEVAHALSGASLLAKRISQFVQNPYEAAGLVVQNLPNSAPGLAGSVGGGLIGGRLAGVPGAVGGSIIGGTAGGYVIESGAALRDQILSEAQARGIDPTNAEALTPLVQEKWGEFVTRARKKGIGTAGTDAVLNTLTIGLAGAGERQIAKQIEEVTAASKAGRIAPDGAKQALDALDSQVKASRSVKGRLKRGTGVAVAEPFGEGVSEAAGQQLAYGEIDPLDVIDEAILGLGQGVAMASGREALTRLAGVSDVQRTDQAMSAAREALKSATSAGEAVAAADTMAGSLDDILATTVQSDLTPAVTATLQPTPPRPAPDPVAAAALEPQAELPTLQPVRPTLAQQQRAVDLDVQAGMQPTAFDTTNLQAQAQVARGEPLQPAGYIDLKPMGEREANQRATVIRDQTAIAGGNALAIAVVPHPTTAGSFAIGLRELPDLQIETPEVTPAQAQQRIETAALTGQVAERQAEDAPRQTIVDQALRRVEARGGVASPAEAAIFAEAGVGTPYDRVDPTLAPALTTDQRLTQATGIALDPPARLSNTGESTRVGRLEAANTQAQAEYQAQRAGTMAQADRLVAETAAASTINQAPALADVVQVLRIPGAQRTSAQVRAVQRAQARLSPEDFALAERAATMPAGLTKAERDRIGGSIPTVQMSTTRSDGGTVDLNGVAHDYRIVSPRTGMSQLINQLARLFGKEVVYFQTATLPADGFVMPENNRQVFINADSAMSPLAVFGHELLHLLKRDNPVAYQAIEAVVMRRMSEGTMEAFRRDYGETANIEELSADLMGNAFSDPTFLADVFNEIAAMAPTEAQSIIARLAAAIQKAIRAARAIIDRMPPAARGFRADTLVQNLEEIRAALRSALVDYANQQQLPARQLEAARARAEAQVSLDAGTQAAPEAQPVTASTSRPDRWKATPEDRRLAEEYFEINGIYPYLSEGNREVKVEGASFSVKRVGKYGDHPVLGIPVNKNGTVTVYYPTTAADARRIARDKTLAAADDNNRIYVTNESAGWRAMEEMGNIPQETDGSVIALQVNPDDLQIDREYPDGRKDFFIPTKEGQYFDQKMSRLWALRASRRQAIDEAVTNRVLKDRVAQTLAEYLAMTPKEQRAASSAAKQRLEEQHNVTTLLGENGKLEKTRVNDLGLTYDGNPVASLGLGMASAQKINNRLSTCPNSAACEGLCLGDTAGQNRLYGGAATQSVAGRYEKQDFRAGPRLSQYLKTEAFVASTGELTIRLHEEINRFEEWCEANGYQPAIRLNVTSDISPDIWQPLIEAHPNVYFYDYTKLNSKPVAPNHHLTYSSTGASQIIDGKPLVNPQSNWDKMVRKLQAGSNVAMAFTDRKSMPKFVVDAKTGERFEVWDGDNYDARFLDPVRDDGRGLIIGLTNKDKTGRTDDAAVRNDGFFIDYVPKRDGDTVTIPDQSQIGGRQTIPIAASTRRPEFTSALTTGLSEAKTNSAPASAWKQVIKGMVNKGAVKAEEVEWSSINDFLDLQQGKVTKQELLDYVAKNGVKVYVTMLGGSRLDVVGPLYVDQVGDGEWSIFDQRGEPIGGTYDSYEAAVDGADAMEVDNPTRYSQYTLPGGENYQETLLTLPEGEDMRRVDGMIWRISNDLADDILVDLSAAGLDRYDYGRVETTGGAANIEFKNLPVQVWETVQRIGRSYDLTSVHVRKLKETGTKTDKDVRSPHWDQSNVIAHIRTTERTQEDGDAKILFVEELQSDWAQNARKRGFRDQIGGRVFKSEEGITLDIDPDSPLNPTDSTASFEFEPDDPWAVEWADGTYSYGFTSEAEAELAVRNRQANAAERGPFIGTTDAWLNLALKQVIKQAVDGGYQAVAFITGPESAKRYNLDPEAQGKGMISFYDQIVPKAVSKLVKRIANGRIEPVLIQGDADELQVVGDRLEPLTRQGFYVNPAMRQAVDEGLPLFSMRRNIYNNPAPVSRWTQTEDSKLDTFLRVMQDKFVDMRRVVEAIDEQTGRIEDRFNPYLAEELYHGRSATATTEFLNREVRPLLEAMQRDDVTVADLDTYLHNRHAEERNEQIAAINPAFPDGGSGIDTADARAYLDGLPADRRATMEQLAAQVDAITKGTRQLLLDSGLETDETIAEWESTYSKYVPLQREESDYGFGGALGTGAGYAVRGPASKRATGSSRNVVDVLANVVMQRERQITRAEKTRVGRALYGLVVQNPNTDFWFAFDPEGAKSTGVAEGDLIRMGISPEDAANILQEPTQAVVNKRTGLVSYRPNPLLRNSNNVFPVRVDGRERYIFFNSNNDQATRMVEALKNLDANTLGMGLQYVAPVTRYFASINTQYNPIFGVLNLVRDTGGAAFNLTTTEITDQKAKVMAGIAPAMAGIYRQVRAERAGRPDGSGDWAALWRDFTSVGGQTGYRDMFNTSDDRAKKLQGEIKRIREGKVKQAGRAIFDWLSDYNQTLENAVRLSAYKAALDKGLSKEKSASIAKNLTVNFNRKGKIGQQMGAAYAFFNASAQGTARLAQTMAGPAGKKIAAGGMLLGSAQALLLAAAGFDKDEPPGFVKERNLVIPIGGKKYITIPMPLGLNVIPNTGRVITEWVLDDFRDPEKRVAEITGAFLDMFNPIGNAGWSMQTFVPTAFDPPAALWENRDWLGRPIAREDIVGTRPTPGHTRAKESASTVSKALSWAINRITNGTDYKRGGFSPTPDQIDYLIGQATGGVGRELQKIDRTIRSTVTGEELPPYSIPLVGRFYGDAGGKTSVSSAYYRNLTRLNEHAAEIKGRREDRQPLGDYFQQYPEARAWQMANAIERQVNQLKRRRRVMLERGASKESVKQIERMITRKMEVLNQRVKNLEDSR